jgi:hypothetical protein
VGPQGWSGRVRKISPSPGFDLRTVQQVVRRCTDLATRPTLVSYSYCIKFCILLKFSCIFRISSVTSGYQLLMVFFMDKCCTCT